MEPTTTGEEMPLEHAVAGTEQHTDEVDAPLVFQCCKCKTLVGDTFSFECAVEELKSVCLKTAANVVIKQDKRLNSDAGYDAGSSYQTFECKNCDSILGNVYIATPQKLDRLRDLYTFSTETISSYKLGSGDETDNIKLSSELQNENLDFLEIRRLSAVVEDLRDSELKIQNLLLVFNERISALEMTAKQSETRSHKRHRG